MPSRDQVGLITLRADQAGDPSHLLGTAPAYALVPAAGEIARFGLIAPSVNLPIEFAVTVRSFSDYGLDLSFQSLPEAAPLTGAKLILWGVPADPVHDAQRFAAGSPGAPAGCPGAEGTGCISEPNPVAALARPLLHNPTACDGPLSSAFGLTTYQHPGNVLSATFTEPGTSGCRHNAFSPMLLAGLTTAQTRSPSGLSLEIQVADEGVLDPYGITQSAIESAAVALPAGVRFDSAAAAELANCTDAQFAQSPIACPVGSAAGTFSMAVAGLGDPLDGSAYLGTPAPGGTQRLLLAASGPSFGAKLVALLEPDSAGEPVTVSLPQLPQLPLEELRLELAVDRELLTTPARCGTYEAQGTLSPWGAPSVPALNTSNSIFLTSTGPGAGPCPGPAAAVALSLSPATIRADGSATSLATATVSDAGGIPVPGDEIVFSSTDPGQRIGAVTDHEDGTYSARVVASTAAGTATIAATDTTVDPGVSASATLTQLAPELSRPAPIVPRPATVSRQPRLTIAKKPPRRGHDRTPTFRFASSPPGASFSCKLDRQRFRPCSSPRTLAKLSFGAHNFSIRATSPAGAVSSPASFDFVVTRAGAR